jgi:hypothetical protein
MQTITKQNEKEKALCSVLSACIYGFWLTTLFVGFLLLSLVFCVMSYKIKKIKLYCQSFLNLRLLITSLVFSNFSFLSVGIYIACIMLEIYRVHLVRVDNRAQVYFTYAWMYATQVSFTSPLMFNLKTNDAAAI